MILTNSGFPEANPLESRNGLFHREKKIEPTFYTKSLTELVTLDML